MSTRQGTGPADKTSAEERILAAAAKEFAANGFYGARTQAIAHAAGVNKAMLHYYFRSKENLYSQVIKAAFRKILTQVGRSWLGPGPPKTRIEKVVDSYMDNYEENPGHLKIILREVVDGGVRLKQAITELKKSEIPQTEFTPGEILKEAAHELGLSPDDTIHFLVNLIGMCAVSFTSPLLLETILEVDVSDMKAFLGERRRAIKAMVLASMETLLAKRGSRRRNT